MAPAKAMIRPSTPFPLGRIIFSRKADPGFFLEEDIEHTAADGKDVSQQKTQSVSHINGPYTPGGDVDIHDIQNQVMRQINGERGAIQPGEPRRGNGLAGRETEGNQKQKRNRRKAVDEMEQTAAVEIKGFDGDEIVKDGVPRGRKEKNDKKRHFPPTEEGFEFS